MPRRITLRTVVTWVVSLILIVFLPIALLGVILPIDDYQAQGLIGPVDCDGPIEVMIFIVPSLAIYAAGAVYYSLRLEGQKRAVLLILCVVILSAVGGKAWTVYREHVRPERQTACGKGW